MNSRFNTVILSDVGDFFASDDVLKRLDIIILLLIIILVVLIVGVIANTKKTNGSLLRSRCYDE